MYSYVRFDSAESTSLKIASHFHFCKYLSRSSAGISGMAFSKASNAIRCSMDFRCADLKAVAYCRSWSGVVVAPAGQRGQASLVWPFRLTHRPCGSVIALSFHSVFTIQHLEQNRYGLRGLLLGVTRTLVPAATVSSIRQHCAPLIGSFVWDSISTWD